MKLKYEKEMVTERDYYNTLNTAREDGRAEEKIRIARVLKEKGMDVSIIASATGLSEAQVSEL